MKYLVVAIVMLIGLSNASSQMIPFVEDDYLGYMDADGNTVIPAIYDTPISIVYKVYGLDSFPSFEVPKWAYFSEGSATIRLRKKFFFITYGFEYAVIDKNNNFLLGPLSDITGSYKDGLAVYQFLQKTADHTYGEKFGVINRDIEFVVDPYYDYISDLSEGYFLALLDKKYGYLDKEGSIAVPFKFIDAGVFGSGLAPARIDELWGYIDKTGNFVVTPKYKYAWSFKEGAARYFDGYSYGFIKIDSEANHNKISNMGQAIYSVASDFSEGLACVQDPNGLFGYIDKSGNYVIKPQFTYASSFSDGLAVAERDSYFGYIDKSGKFVIEPQYYYAEDFRDGVAKVWIGKTLHFINKSNKKIYFIDLSR